MSSGTTLNLEELRRRLDNAQVVGGNGNKPGLVVDQLGTLRPAEDPAVAMDPSMKKTSLKPSRWFA